jgi:GNAT superfamily N-acetyltransferase
MTLKVVPLASRHKLDDFTCGLASLDNWLHVKARANNEAGNSRVFVIADRDNNVIAYYSIVAGSILRSELPRASQRNTPITLPTILLARFAVDLRFQAKGLGRSMLQDALLRCNKISKDLGVAFIQVHPADALAKEFWVRWGFLSAPSSPPSMLLPAALLASFVDPELEN